MTNPNAIEFLEVWIDQNVPMQRGNRALAEVFAKQLLIDAAVQGYTVEDMDLQGYDIAQYMLQAMNVTPAGRDDPVLLI